MSTLVTVTHFRAVTNDGGGGIAFSLTPREGRDARERVAAFVNAHHERYHLEVWEQTYEVGPSTWTKVEPS